MADASPAASALEAFDVSSRPDRAERLLWLAQFQIGPPVVQGRPEVLELKEEARVCYVNGLYISTLLTALSCVEQMLSVELELIGSKEPRRDFAQCIEAARREKVADPATLDAADRLREFRNAFAHRKHKEDDKARLPIRMRTQNRHPRSILEEDAQVAIRTMYAVFHATLRPFLSGCKCGCGEAVQKGRVFLNKEHQLRWLNAGGAAELNALLPDEVRVRGGLTAGAAALESGRLAEASKQGAAKVRSIAQQFHAKKSEG